jgi:hypothetical protein
MLIRDSSTLTRPNQNESLSIVGPHQKFVLFGLVLVSDWWEGDGPPAGPTTQKRRICSLLHLGRQGSIRRAQQLAAPLKIRFESFKNTKKSYYKYK